MPKNELSKSLIVMDQNYQRLLVEAKSIIAKGQSKAYKSVDNIRVQTYWQLGERIVREELNHKERADYGQYLIAQLSDDLGFRRRQLYEIVKFYRIYPIVRSVTAQLGLAAWKRRYLSLNIN